MTGPVLAHRRFPALAVATPRLHFRPLDVADAPELDTILADPLTRRWLRLPGADGPLGGGGGTSPPLDGLGWCTDLAVRQRERGDGEHYGVLRREDGRLVGLVCTWRTDWAAGTTEVGVLVAPKARGYGVAAEAVDALAVTLLLEHGFGRVEMRVPPGNVADRRDAEKAGFRYEGVQRNAGYVYGGRVDLEMWSLVRGDLKV